MSTSSDNLGRKAFKTFGGIAMCLAIVLIAAGVGIVFMRSHFSLTLRPEEPLCILLGGTGAALIANAFFSLAKLSEE